MPHKVQVVVKDESGRDVLIMPITGAGQVECTVPDTSTGGNKVIPLTELLNDYADEINEHAAGIAALGSRIDNVASGLTPEAIGAVPTAATSL